MPNSRFQFLFFAEMGKSLETHAIAPGGFLLRLLDHHHAMGQARERVITNRKRLPTIFTYLCIKLTGDCLNQTHLSDMATEPS